MVSVKIKRVKDKTYYYLTHTFRVAGKVQYKEAYIGTKLPHNITKIKAEFLSEIYKEKWFKIFDKIQKQFKKEESGSPESLKEKEIATFMINFTYSTNKIEGSKLSLFETANLLEKGIVPASKPLHDIKEAESHRKTFYNMINYKKNISLEIILSWHRMLFSETKPDIAGQIRNRQVLILGSQHLPPPPAIVYRLLVELIRWYNKNRTKIHPVELAALFHLKFESIHPFGDGNGRIGRLLMNFILYKNSFPMLNIRYENRGGYYASLEKANVKDDESAFVQWFFKKYLRENRRYL
ncbi:MAG: Fic family protein [Candidatus Micrarchaeales archaeon]